MWLRVNYTWHDRRLEILQTLREAFEVAAWQLLLTAEQTCPIDTGALRRSAGVAATMIDGEPEVYAYYNTPYAVTVHEHPEWHFRPPGKGKWLETTFNETAGDLLELIRKHMGRRLA